MSLTTKQIIALQLLNNCGVSTVKSFADFSQLYYDKEILTNEDLLKFVNTCIYTKVANRCKLSKLSIDEIDKVAFEADRIIEDSESMGIKAISYLDNNYPKNLLETVDEKGKLSIPLVIYFKGDIKVADKTGIAIIGTREPTLQGIQVGEYLGKVFAAEGFNIVSGLAFGCDAAGHRGALNCENGVTTAFLANGLDSIYPEENTDLAEKIVNRGGLLISEYHIGTYATRYNLVARDRLQAAMSAATVVIQTGVNGGTYHAANATLRAHKPLFCVKYTSADIMENANVLGNTELVNRKGAHACWLSSSNAVGTIREALGRKYLFESNYSLF